MQLKIYKIKTIYIIYMLNLLKNNKISTKYRYSIKTNMKNVNTLDCAIKSLNGIIKHNPHKKIINVIPLEQPCFEIPHKKYNGIKLICDNGEVFNIKCSSDSIGAIMWYYDIDNHVFTSNVDYNTKYYILKSLRE